MSSLPAPRRFDGRVAVVPEGAVARRPARQIYSPARVWHCRSLPAIGARTPTRPSRRHPAPPPPAVVVAEVVQKTVPIYSEFVAQTDARDTVEIRARVQAFLEAQHFTEGTVVKKGQLLFTLDKREYETKLQQAKAAARVAPGATGQGRNRRATPAATGRAEGRAATGLRQRRREPGHRARRGLRREGRCCRGRADLGYTHDPLSDHRPDRQPPGGSGQPGGQERGHAAGHGVEHRPDPCQRHRQRSGVPALFAHGRAGRRSGRSS